MATKARQKQNVEFASGIKVRTVHTTSRNRGYVQFSKSLGWYAVERVHDNDWVATDAVGMRKPKK